MGLQLGLQLLDGFALAFVDWRAGWYVANWQIPPLLSVVSQVSVAVGGRCNDPQVNMQLVTVGRGVSLSIRWICVVASGQRLVAISFLSDAGFTRWTLFERPL